MAGATIGTCLLQEILLTVSHFLERVKHLISASFTRFNNHWYLKEIAKILAASVLNPYTVLKLFEKIVNNKMHISCGNLIFL